MFRIREGTWMEAIRRNADGTVDDVAIHCDMFRLEQMSEDSWWAAAYRGEGEAHQGVMFMLRWDKKRKEIVCVCYEDTIGCIDDSEED